MIRFYILFSSLLESLIVETEMMQNDSAGYIHMTEKRMGLDIRISPLSFAYEKNDNIAFIMFHG